ncbi:uncharacterized protein LOC129759187 [Uranotaenia lowii]|uniref:uncharacterized protein LOC129759187 n=1 Tax=Uranotaenia lowii TaxID=190385 RepID=UPI00247AC044|nr:uncharacterized protein LOC129759187 [Uranotaenia lowii]
MENIAKYVMESTFNGVKRHNLPAGKSDHLILYYQNVGGINSCVSDYLLASSCSCYDISALTETWLSDRTLSSQVFSSDYTVFRCDRGPNNSTKSTGGGVLIAIRSTLSAIPIYDESWNDQEFVWTRIDLGTKKLYVGVVYLPPDRTRNASFADSFSSGLSKLCSLTLPEDDIVIIGDFNLPGLKWIPSQGNFWFADPTNCSPGQGRSSFTVPSNTILDSLSTATLREINSIENENGRMLDLCFISDGPQLATIEEAPTPLVKVVPHHPALLLSLDIPRAFAHIEKRGQFFLDFKNADFVAVSQTLDAIDWESELESSDPNAAAMKFSHIINYVIDRHVPKRSSVSNLRAPWVTKELRQMKTLKNKALRYYTRHKTLRAKNEYCKLNSAYKKLCSRCYQSYLIRIQRGFKTKPKSFWQYIKGQRKESGLPPSMFLDDNLATSEPEICGLFADKFRSVFDSNSISSDQVTSAAFSLDQSTFLSLWKEAYMFPVHKKGDRRNVNNYRGISALCAIAKLFELVVLEPIFSYCKLYFSNEKHGFMPKRSTTTNLLTFTSTVQDSFAMGSQTDVIYTDLSAAFDKVNHSIAIAKLDRIGICGSLLEWFRSYLVGRKFIVRIGESFSSQFSAKSGVPQGSHLGPIIFLIYFNGVLLLLDGPKLAYVDDLKLYRRINGPEDVNFLQSQFNLFASWCDVNCLPLNRSKCAVISFSRKRLPLSAIYHLGNEAIARVEQVKDLGVILDTKLNFKTHTNYIVDKASRCLGVLFRMTKDSKDVYCLKSLYYPDCNMMGRKALKRAISI